MARPGASEYKRRNMASWNEVAPRYHRRWAGSATGPFQSTEKLVEMLGVKKGDRVLDLACGTGAVTRKLASRVGRSGTVIGADTSFRALKIARRNSRGRNVHFVNADAERMGLVGRFDRISCQYALFFFPDAPRALRGMRGMLAERGTIGIAVHGHGVPFYTNMLNAIKEFIPDYISPGTPQLDRYGSKPALRDVVRDSGFSRVAVKEFVFRYSPGTLEQYWENYRRYIARPLRERLDSLTGRQKELLMDKLAGATRRYAGRDGTIEFPWQVLILTARR